MMPKMDGYEVCKQVKGDPATRHIPVMMVTAFSSQADRQRALEVGADDFVRKPINLENLVAVIQKTVPQGKNERGNPHDG
jgi:two-component system cell cycle response regulator